MYPIRTPPAHLRGDPGQPRLLDGVAVFAIGAGLSTALTFYALRILAIYSSGEQWKAVPLLRFPGIFIHALFSPGVPFLWFSAGVAILSAGLIGVGVAVWAGVVMGRAIGGVYGIRYIAGPVMQTAPPPGLNKKTGIQIAQGIWLDLREECRHMKVSGSTGTGKTTVIFPIIKQVLARMDRCIIWDEKAGFVETLPNATILCPWDRRAERWALSIDLKDKSSIQDFANHVCPSPSTGDSIWARAAAAIVIGCAIQLSETQGKWYLCDLRRQILAVSIDLNVLQKTVQAYYPEAAGIVADLKSKALSSVIFQLSASLQSILMLGEMDAELEKLGRKPFSLSAYLRPSQPGEPPLPMSPVLLPGHPNAPELSSTFCGAIINYVSKNLSGRPDTPPDKDATWLFLDEFPQLGRQDGVIRLLEVGRSKSVRVVIGIQGPEQILRVYNHEHVLKTILNNTLTKFHFQYLDHDAAEWASESLGKSHWKVRRVSHTTGGNGGQNVSWQDVESAVYQPDEFRTRLGPRESTRSVYCIIAGLFSDPILSRHPFLSDPKLRVARDTIEILVPRPLQISATATVPDATAANIADEDTVLNPPSTAKQVHAEPTLNADAHDRVKPAPVLAPVQAAIIALPSLALQDESGDEVEEKLVGSAFTSTLDVVIPGVGTALDLIEQASEITDASLPVSPDQSQQQASVSQSQPISLLDKLRAQKRREREQQQETEGGMEC